MLMTRKEIFDRLKDLLVSADGRNAALAEHCTEASRLVADFGLSSVNMLYMVIAIEEDFDIRFEDVGINSFETLGDVIDYIEGQLK